jgi:hypothetical protein
MSERKPPSPERIERAPPAESFKSKSDARERRYDYYEATPSIARGRHLRVRFDGSEFGKAD